MTSWTAVVLAGSGRDDGMRSRLPTCLHPVAGRPLLWHAVATLAAAGPAPARVVVLAAPEVPPDLLGDLPVPVEVWYEDARVLPERLGAPSDSRILLLDARVQLDPATLQALPTRDEGWLEVGGIPVAMWLSSAERLRAAAGVPDVLGAAPSLLPGSRLRDAGSSLVVRTREDLGHVSRRVRDRLVRALMDGGVTFLLPESVLVDVDVRIGRDSIVYPGVVIEGQTTIGDETVVGPGCRIIDSWVGSGVELKGWNYISRTSIRNRAILEPYVRRGFD